MSELNNAGIHFRFFKDLIASERLKVFKAFGVYPENCTDRLSHSIEHRLLDAILKRRAPSAEDRAQPAEAMNITAELQMQVLRDRIAFLEGELTLAKSIIRAQPEAAVQELPNPPAPEHWFYLQGESVPTDGYTLEQMYDYGNDAIAHYLSKQAGLCESSVKPLCSATVSQRDLAGQEGEQPTKGGSNGN